MGWRALKEALSLRPNVVLAGSGLTAPFALIAARLTGATAAAYLHGLDLAVDHQVYRRLWLPTIRRLDCIIANSRATAKLAEEVGIPAERITIVHPGVEIPYLSDDEQQRQRWAFRNEYGLGERPILLSVGRLTTRKGIIPFVRDVLPKIVQTVPNVCLLIIGDVPKGALAAQAETPEAILSAALAAGIEANVRHLGFMSGEPLTRAYFASDVHVFPVRQILNDPEGFGMVAIEAAAHGLPTLTYATGGVTDAVSDGISGRLVTPGDTRGFAQAVLTLLAEPLPKERIRSFADGFAWKHFGAQISCSITQSAKTLI
jgi:phosphatidylinositol alpha-1,6-mannosyltransferase